MKAEQFIKDYTKNCSNRCSTIEQYERGDEFHPWLTPDQALKAVEIEKEEVIEKACQFIEIYPHLFMGVLRSEVIEDFKKYMEG